MFQYELKTILTLFTIKFIRNDGFMLTDRWYMISHFHIGFSKFHVKDLYSKKGASIQMNERSPTPRSILERVGRIRSLNVTFEDEVRGWDGSLTDTTMDTVGLTPPRNRSRMNILQELLHDLCSTETVESGR